MPNSSDSPQDITVGGHVHLEAPVVDWSNVSTNIVPFYGGCVDLGRDVQTFRTIYVDKIVGNHITVLENRLQQMAARIEWLETALASTGFDNLTKNGGQTDA